MRRGGERKIDFLFSIFPATHHLAPLKVLVVRVRWNRPDKEIEYCHLSVIVSSSNRELSRGRLLAQLGIWSVDISLSNISNKSRIKSDETWDTFVTSWRKVQAVSPQQPLNFPPPRETNAFSVKTSFLWRPRWQSDTRDTWVDCSELGRGFPLKPKLLPITLSALANQIQTKQLNNSSYES